MFKGLKYNYAALCVCAIACCAWGYVVDLAYFRMMYFSWDLALYAHLMWNLCHGHMSTSLFGGNFLIDHFNAIAFLLVPFYYFFQSALTLLYFKLFAFFAGAYIFYLLASKKLGGFWGLAFMLAYIFYPANVAYFFFEFNFENLALPLIFLLFYCFEEKKFLWFMGICFLLTIVKENMPLVVFMFGVYGLIARKEDRLRWGLFPLLLGAGMFLGEVCVFIPWLRHGLGMANVHLGAYSNLGNTPAEMLRTFIFNEPKVLKLLFSVHNLSFLLKLFGPLLIVVFMAPRAILIAIPLFLQDLLSKSSGQQDINSFYSSTLTVFIFVAVIDFISRVKDNLRGYLLGIMIVSLLIFDQWYIPLEFQKLPPVKEQQVLAQEFISQIPPDAGVYSSYKFLYLLSQRKDLHVLFLKHKVFSIQQESVPDSVDYMIVDFANRVDNKDVVRQMLSGGAWVMQAAADETVLLRKNRARKEAFINEGEKPFSSMALQPAMMAGPSLRMEWVDIPRVLKHTEGIMPVVFYWKALNDDKNDGAQSLFLNISQGTQSFYLKNRLPLYGLPVKKGEYYKETFYYFISRLIPGDYEVSINPLPADIHQSIRMHLSVR